MSVDEPSGVVASCYYRMIIVFQKGNLLEPNLQWFYLDKMYETEHYNSSNVKLKLINCRWCYLTAWRWNITISISGLREEYSRGINTGTSEEGQASRRAGQQNFNKVRTGGINPARFNENNLKNTKQDL